MKVYILSDMEGTAGVMTWDQVTAGHPTYAEARRWMTQEVNAAARGAFDAGARLVVVNDGHGTENNLAPELLDPQVELLQHPGKGMWAGLDASFDAFFFTGAHARAGTRAANLRHTWAAHKWVELRINGRAMGEIGLFAAGAGELGVPCVLVSGDDKACAEAVDFIPDIVTACVKTGVDWEEARSLSPQAAHDLIRRKAARACRIARDISSLSVGGPPITVEIVRLAEAKGEYDASRLDLEQLRAERWVVQRATAPSIPEAFALAMAAKAEASGPEKKAEEANRRKRGRGH